MMVNFSFFFFTLCVRDLNLSHFDIDVSVLELQIGTFLKVKNIFFILCSVRL